MTRTLHVSFGLIFVVTILLQVLLIYSAWFGAPIIQQVETEIGHALSCDEAYDHREIDGFFFPEHAVQGQILYLSILCGPFGAGLLLVLTLGAALMRQRFTRWNWLLLGLVLALLVPILLYLPTIQKIACATE